MTVALDRPTGSRLRWEIAIVLLLSLGQSAVYAIVSLTAKLTAGSPLSSQAAVLNRSQSSRPDLDLTYQLLGIFFALVPVLLVFYLLGRAPIGVDLRRPGFDLRWGTMLAAGIGIPGLLLVYAAAQLGLNAQIVPAALNPVWWAVPVLILSAVQNSVLEEVVVVGYLMTRLRELRLSLVWIIAGPAVLRGSYHLYQGFGAFVGNLVMGVVFGWFYVRYRRVMPLVVAHTLLDVVAFVGYTVLPERWLSWL